MFEYVTASEQKQDTFSSKPNKKTEQKFDTFLFRAKNVANFSDYVPVVIATDTYN